MRISKIILAVLLLLMVAAVVTWFALNYLIWPKPEILGLVPGTPMGYIAASGLSEALSAAQESEFVSQVAVSPFWKQLTSSDLWTQLKAQRRFWERRMRLSIKPEGIIKLVGKDAVLALYAEEGRLDILLISEVDILARINIKSGRTEKALSKVYKVTKEKYKGAELITMVAPTLKFSYSFIGRAGMLSTDASLLKKTIDLHKGIGQGVLTAPEFRKLAAGLSRSDISFHIDAAKIREIAGPPGITPLVAREKTDQYLRYLTPVARRVDVWAGAGFRQDGDLIFDVRAAYEPPASSRQDEVPNPHPIGLRDLASDKLPVPADCLLFAVYEMLEQDTLFETLGIVTGSNPTVVSDNLAPVLHNGAALAVLKPDLEELQLLPPVMIFFQVKDRRTAQEALETLKGSITFRGRQLRFTETEYARVPVSHTRIPIGMGMSLDAGYTFIGDDLLVTATDTSALEAAIDVSLGKRASLMEDEHYTNVLNPIVEASEGRIFMDIESIAAITKQAGKLYAWRAGLAGDHKAEQIATLLYQNVFILEVWRYMGATFGSEGGRVGIRLILSSQ
jgi:hypothetical protein